MRVILLAFTVLALGLPAHGQNAPAPNSPRWLERPTGRDFARAYPRRALRDGVEGEVQIECVIGADGRLENCAVASEEPGDLGFGDAGLQVSRAFRLSTAMPDGLTTFGERVRIPMHFNLH